STAMTKRMTTSSSLKTGTTRLSRAPDVDGAALSAALDRSQVIGVPKSPAGCRAYPKGIPLTLTQRSRRCADLGRLPHFAVDETDDMDLKEEQVLGADINRHWYYVAKARLLAARIGKAGTVLDVGAGSGFFSRWLLSNGLAER